MSYLVIKGGVKLEGSLPAVGAKNAALPLMAASILIEEPVTFENVPDITDVDVMVEILEAIGGKILYDRKGTMQIDMSGIHTFQAPYDLVKKIHASFDITGPLIARFNQAQVPLPGGCVLGYRGVNFHIEGFQALGASVVIEHGYLIAKADKLEGNRILIGRSSVGATKNILMAACKAKGVTILENAAREPEVADLARFLNSCGAKIEGVGSSEMRIEGVQKLHGTTHRIIPDRLEAGTWLLSALMTKGDIQIKGIPPYFLGAFLDKLEAAGAVAQKNEDSIRVTAGKTIHPIEILTSPFPGFPTDLQPQFVSCLSLASGTSLVTETIFDGRFMYVAELLRMGADIRVVERTCVVKGVKELTGAPVEASDIRAGGALILASLAAQGESRIGGIEYIDRGYEKPEIRLKLLGAEIERIQESDKLREESRAYRN
ncbi:MAG: UDP-N-acetylglucosamine 1-carboxyvinyltransferase [Candidatus Eremiobacteraeota bacterium]|nr:UDP-N-acetylglucosamine 1-carboxyvinyltransferase [Candidatus Eremiobacteraeota bacterium]MCL5055107.1 UDP-N-acetylglucosamine 1-carboxyvinyltransferase [Bacillota bacterium]